MKFNLNYNPKQSAYKIAHKDSVLLIGSCFSEHIGNRLSDLKFKVNSNPFGIVFNPKSIELMLLRILKKNYFAENDIFEKEGLYFCFEAHSEFSETGAEKLLKKLNDAIDHYHSALTSLDFLIITFGSAFAYRHYEQNRIVANCHKLPQSVFEKVLLEQDEIINDYIHLINEIKTINPGIKLIFTVSPVKHLRDGVEENSLSKAVLIQSVHKLIKQSESCFYFPAYELVNDDLRDYRFYEADMAHPDKQAIDYVWQKFTDVYFNTDTLYLKGKLMQIDQAMKHRLFNEHSESTLKFKKEFHQKCEALKLEFPFLDLREELNYFSN